MCVYIYLTYLYVQPCRHMHPQGWAILYFCQWHENVRVQGSVGVPLGWESVLSSLHQLPEPEDDEGGYGHLTPHLAWALQPFTELPGTAGGWSVLWPCLIHACISYQDTRKVSLQMCF